MREIVINRCYGGFGLSEKAKAHMVDLGHESIYPNNIPDDYDYEKNPMEYVDESEIERDNSYLVQTVKDLGSEASDNHAELKIVSIPKDALWQIEGYDGMEWIAEQHRIWSE